MDEYSLTQKLQRSAAGIPPKTRFCPDEELLVRFFEGNLADDAHASLRRHVVDCRYCQAQLGNLSRSNSTDLDVDVEVPGPVLAEAKQLSAGVGTRPTRRAPAWAAAAVLVVALAITFGNKQQLERGSKTTPGPAPANEATRQLRTLGRNLELQVRNPLPGAAIPPDSTLRWDDVPGNLHYDVLILSSNGDVLLTERLAGNQWPLDSASNLAAGNSYYFRVVAYLPDGRTLNSRHVEFRLAEAE